MNRFLARSLRLGQTVPRPRGDEPVLHVFLAGGRREALFEMIDCAWEWGQSLGCSAMTLAGRKGWTRTMTKHGFRPTLYVMEKN